MLSDRTPANSPAVLTLSERVRRLEHRRAAVAAISASGAACDTGPYDPSVATAAWRADGEFGTDATVYRGRDSIHEFFDGLSATFTLHVFSNIELKGYDAAGRPIVHCYGLEAPALGGVPHFGAFTHLVICDPPPAVETLRSWQQRIHLITPVLLGWVRGPKVAEQST